MRRSIVLLAVALLASVSPVGHDGLPLAHADVAYIYDALGRLVAVVDSTSNEAAIYSYDAVGNLLSISRQSASVVSIIEFTPGSGPVGTAVTIYGTGFSATASQNSVAFNGTTASVVSATSTQIVATVPVGATTGPISVTAPGGSAMSSDSFTVGTPGAPTITSFFPTIGAPTTPVAITGTNFEITAANDRVRFNDAAYALVESATASTISTRVPNGTGSGHLYISTPAGQAVSSDDLFVPPPPYTAGDVQVTGRMTVGGSNFSAAISTANRIGLIVFDGVGGQRLSLGVTTTVTSNYITVNNPDGSALKPATLVTTSGAGWDLAPLPRTGTYTIVIDPYASYTGNTTLTLSEDLPRSITIDGAALTLSLRSGQNARVTFAGAAGQRVSVAMTGVTITQSSVSILKPDGTTVVAPTTIWSGSGGVIDMAPLPATGTYTIFVDPQYGYAGDMTLTVSSEITGTISVDGPPVSVNISRVGQNARLVFSGTAGQRIGLGISGVTAAGYYTIFNPDGSVFTPATLANTGAAAWDLAPLPSTGTYTLFMDASGFNISNYTFTLSTELTTSIAVNSSAITLNLNRIAQNARVTFEAAAGQRVSLLFTSVSVTQSTVALYNPDGSTLVAPTTIWGNAASTIDTAVLPTTGTYAITIDPLYAYTGSMTLQLSAEITGSIIADGAAVTATVTTPGQRARLTFDATAGQRASVAMTGVTIGSASCCTFNLYVVKPDGTSLTSGSYGTAGGTPAFPLYPVTGTYALLIDPNTNLTGNVTLTLSNEITGDIVVDGAAVPVSISRIGQNARLTFSGTAGQHLKVTATNVTMVQVYISVLRPDGTNQLAPSLTFNGTTTYDLGTLPVTGAYAIFIDPYQLRTGGATLTLITVTP